MHPDLANCGVAQRAPGVGLHDKNSDAGTGLAAARYPTYAIAVVAVPVRPLELRQYHRLVLLQVRGSLRTSTRTDIGA